MDIYTAISTRRTIRDFADRPVPQVIVEKILGAGLKAPTNDHLRNWEFVVVDDKNTRAEILQAMAGYGDVPKQLDAWGLADALQRDMYLEALPKQQAMIYNAGCLILPFFRCRSPLLQPKTLSSLNGFASIWCCIENMLLAAAAEGIFGVTRIPMQKESEHIQQVIKHPAEYTLPCYLALGYPAEGAVLTVQKDISVQERMHRNVW